MQKFEMCHRTFQSLGFYQLLVPGTWHVAALKLYGCNQKQHFRGVSWLQSHACNAVVL